MIRSFIKTSFLHSRRALSGLVLACVAGTSMAGAPGLPDKPIRLIVGVSPGGLPDMLARSLAEQLTRNTGNAFVVENRVGAAGLIAINSVLNADPDGTSLLLAETGSYGIAPHLTGFNPFESNLVPVALLCTAPVFLAVNPSLGVSDVREFIEYAKAHPEMPYGSSGNGSVHQLAMELLKTSTGIQLTHVPYRGAAQSALALVSGEVKAAFLGMTTALPQEQSGKLKILAIAAPARSPVLPNVPTIAESGVPGYGISVTLGFFTATGTSPAIISALNREMMRVVQSPAMRDKLAAAGIEAATVTATPAQYAQIVKKEFAAYGKIVKTANLKLE